MSKTNNGEAVWIARQVDGRNPLGLIPTPAFRLPGRLTKYRFHKLQSAHHRLFAWLEQIQKQAPR